MLRFEKRHSKVKRVQFSPENGQQVKAGTQAGRKESSEAAEVAQEKGRGRVSEGSGWLAGRGGGGWRGLGTVGGACGQQVGFGI